MTVYVNSLTDDAASFTALATVEYDARRNVPNVLHQIIGRGDVDVTFKPGGLRSGSMTLLFDSYDDADGASSSLATTPGVWAYGDGGDELTIIMRLVVNGETALVLDETRAAWLLQIPFQEVVYS